VLGEDEQDTNSPFCNVIVEDPVDLVDFDFSPDFRYLSTDDVINATLVVGKGKKNTLNGIIS